MYLMRKFGLQAALFAGLMAVLANLKPIAVASIGFYQSHISPSIDRPCRHRLMLGGESCSAFAKREIGEKGFFAGMSVSVERFRECGALSRGQVPGRDGR